MEPLNRARKLTSDGDKTALRAMLTAPTYLTGVNEKLLTLIRDEAARRVHPGRARQAGGIPEGRRPARAGGRGVIRYLSRSRW